MVRAWYMDDSDADQREKHMPDPPEFLSLMELQQKVGVLYFKFDADTHETCEKLGQLKKDRGYTYEDKIEIKKGVLENYNQKLKMFFEEHLHSDEEIRYILDGSGYFDVRDRNERWIRIECVKDDLIILPAGIYHRFTLDTKNYIKAKRFFVGEPVWTPHNRPADDHPARVQYLKQTLQLKA